MNDKLCGAKQECVVLDSILEFCPVRYMVLYVELLHVLPSLRPHCSNFCLWPLNVFLTGLQLVLQWLTGCVCVCSDSHGILGDTKFWQIERLGFFKSQNYSDLVLCFIVPDLSDYVLSVASRLASA